MLEINRRILDWYPIQADSGLVSNPGGINYFYLFSITETADKHQSFMLLWAGEGFNFNFSLNQEQHRKDMKRQSCWCDTYWLRSQVWEEQESADRRRDFSEATVVILYWL